MKKQVSRFFSLIALAFVLQLSTPVDVQAQCPMCRMSAESNMKNGGSAGKGLNAGILYMLATPYLLVGILGFVWYRNRQKTSEEEAAQ
jgi:hypothetical protein